MTERRPFCEVLAERYEEIERRREARRELGYSSLAEWHEVNVTNAKPASLPETANVGFQHLKARR